MKPREQTVPPVYHHTLSAVELQTKPLARVTFLSLTGAIITMVVADDHGLLSINDQLLTAFIKENSTGELKVAINAGNSYSFLDTIKFQNFTTIKPMQQHYTLSPMDSVHSMEPRSS
ncbi:MAG: hypothetical protein JW795_20220 [Chitinivibrionales bacterium]|nr:hypothetical protein [Chitinivibrionales bacterium]